MNAPQEEHGGLPSLPVRAGQVIFSPEKLFLALQAQPVWFWTMVATVVLASATVFFIPEEAWTNLVREQMLERGASPDDMPNMGAGFRVAAVVGGAVSIFLFEVLIACFTFGLFVFLLGDQGAFKQHLSIVAHAGIITVVGAFVALPLRISQLDPQLTLSVGTLFPFIPEGYLYSVLQSLDLFALWAAVLTGLGVSLLDARRSWGSAATATIGLSVVFALVVGFFR